MQAKILIPCSSFSIWNLNQEESDFLIDCLSTINGTFDQISEGTLGYGGIEVEIDSQETLRAYKGMLELITCSHNNQQIRRFLDIDRELEKWIFATSRDRIDDSIYDHLLIREFKGDVDEN